MPGPKPLPIELTPRQTDFFEGVVRRQKSEQRLVKRANILLLSAQHLRNAQIARQLCTSRDVVWDWRKRWHQAFPDFALFEQTLELLPDGPETKTRHKEYIAMLTDFLEDRERSGKPPDFTPEQIVQLIALACQSPEQYGRPISHWTPRELRDESLKQGIFESISVSSIGRFLKRSRLKTPSKPLLVEFPRKRQ